MIKYYTLVPTNVSPRLKEWAKKNLSNSNNSKEYLNKILNEFNNNDFFYSLTPLAQGNNYEDFFFNSKTGYCEYFAGTFALLARLAGIPSRIITGYYGGSFNDLGKFYTFKQQDAHSWVEIFWDGKWIKYDPTLSIPNENILETNNASFESNNDITETSFETTDITINNFGIYFDYMNYVWTNSFLRYDEKSRNNFIKENLTNLDNLKILVKILLVIAFIILLLRFMAFIFYKKVLFNLFFSKIRKGNKKIQNHMTHQEIFKCLEKKDQLRFEYVFKFYEKKKFSKDIKISLKNFYEINVQILKYAYFKR